MKDIKFVAAFILLFASIACSTPRTDNSIVNLTANVNENIASSTPISAGGQLTNTSPETVVAELYKLHDAQKGPFFQSKNRALVDKFFTKPIADLIWRSNNGPTDEVGAIDFDPLYDGQDFEIKNLTFAASDVKDTTATVTANFLNFGEKRSVKYLMKLADGIWKIDDIKYNDFTLLGSLKEYFANEPSKENEEPVSSGEFEGKYTVGPTSCKVKPVKMAFEINWTKGTGTETFFPAGENTFESEPGKNGTNRFVFTDEKYDSGTFYRADGKTFPVKRSK